MFGDDSKLLTEDHNCLLVIGRGERESGDGVEGCAVKEGSQIVEFINFREVGVEMDGRLV